MSTEGQAIKCKAMVLRETNKPMQIETITVEPPKAGEVRAKVIYSSCCHTDLLVMEGNDPETPTNGVILGHESFCVIESVGEGVTSVKPGDYVIPAYIPECSECRWCKHPNTNLCQKVRATQGRGVMPDGTVRYKSEDGSDIRHFMSVSGFSQYIVTQEISVVKVDESLLPFGNQLPIIGCGFTTGYFSVKKSGVTEGSSVAVIGLGGVGLAAVYAAKHMGAKEIYAIDINPEKFALAKKLGATHCVNPKDHEQPIQQVIMGMTQDGQGVDFSFECVGNVQLMRAALEMTIKGFGKAVVIGVATGAEISIKSFYLVSGRIFTGAAFGGVKSRSEIPGLLQEIADKKIVLDDFITDTRPMAEINEAFEDMKKGKTIRTIINMWE